MAKFMQILFIASLAFAVCSAEAARNSRFHGRRTRFLARQEVEDVTPYPTADELRPQVPFDEAIAAGEITPNQPADQPEPAAFQPDEIYG